MTADTTGWAPLRGGAAAALLVGGLGLDAFDGAAGAGPSAGLAVAAGGGIWLIGEWALAVWRGRRQAQTNARLREARDRLRQKREELESSYGDLLSEQADRVQSARLATLGSLVAGIAHELDTPLGSLHSNHDTIRNALARLQDILADERVDESELEEVRRIVRAVDGVADTNELAMERMMDLISSLRTLGRPDGAERGRVDIHETLDDTVTLLDHRFGEEVAVETDYGDLPRIECFPAELNQVFMNLLLNASQAIEGTGRISIRTAGGDGHVEVRIRDTGVGIPDEHVDRIFEPGFSTKGDRVGMGLGLLITRQVVDRHGGEIDVESEVGDGTRFTIRLPVKLPDDAEKREAPVTSTPDSLPAQERRS